MYSLTHARLFIQMNAALSRAALNLVYRRATAHFRVLPEVFILGATKSGSSSLSHMLWQHPYHIAAFRKELMYLQKLPDFRANWESNDLLSFLCGPYENGHARYSVSGYKVFFPTRREMARRRIKVGHAITSDCDPFNLYCPVAMQRIAALQTNPKFIVSLRDPVARAYSDFNMHRTYGGDKRSFSEAIEQELSGTETRFRKRFLNQSIYAPHLERWFSMYPRDRFFILRAEDLFEDNRRVALEMFEFLGFPPAPIDCAPKNVGRYTATVDIDVSQRLREYFRPYNERLYSLLDRDMGWDAGTHDSRE